MNQSQHQVVGILFSEPDRDLAEQMAAYLERVGYGVVLQAEAPVTEASSQVVVMSADALGDPHWQSWVDQARGARLVPVCRDRDVNYDSAPQELAELNWLFWDANRPEVTLSMILRALNTDLGRYREQRGLAALAQVWRNNGSREEELLPTVGAAKQAQIQLRSGGLGISDAAIPTVEQYVDVSLRTAKRRRRIRVVKNAFLLTALVLLFAVPAIWLRSQADAGRGQSLLMIGALGAEVQKAPDVVAIKALAALDVASPGDRDALTSRVLDALNQPWPGNIMVWDEPFTINDVALLGDGDTALSADGGGAVSTWELAEARVRDRHVVSSAPLLAISASRDGKVVGAVGADGSVTVVEPGSWQTCSGTPPDGTATEVAVSVSGNVVAVSDDQGRIFTVTCAGETAEMVQVEQADAVLGMGPAGEQQVTAVVRDGAEIRLLDVNSATVLSRQQLAPTEFEIAAVGLDGTWALSGSGHQVWRSIEPTSPVRPTGVAVPDVVMAMEITDQGDVVYASDQNGVRALLRGATRSVGPLCESTGRLEEISTAGGLTMCGPPWNTADLAPFRPIPADQLADVNISRSLRATGEGGPVEEVHFDPERARLVVDRGEATGTVRLIGIDATSTDSVVAIALMPQSQGVVVATSSSRVNEYLYIHDGAGDLRMFLMSESVVPARSGARGVGYDPETGDIIIESAGGLFYRTMSCADCLTNEQLLWDVVRQKRRNMYSKDLLEMLPDAAKERLAIQPIPKAPEG